MAAHLSTPIVDRGDRPSISDGGLFKIQIGTEKSWKDGLLYYSVGDCSFIAISYAYAAINQKREGEVKKKEDIESQK